ncbi:hypothetical protein L3X38_017387 [Prunus dulcis]|uniref:RNase H type-1 domain-containing protein n=1 Tax=Prunus dulcis TaxID=3755 RepID=A0AAD4W9M2_PRUDU|nr:hypothetical protein L3X38_017387 [Prunus dulcis]
MPGLDRQLVEHKLPIKDGYLPVKQARRRMSMDTELKVKEEIERLLKAGFIRPAIYADWLANIVPVLKRKIGAVRICVDYRNLNEASPKDEYPMPMAECYLLWMAMQAGNFLGFLVHQRGIEVDKNKAKSIIEALPPRNKKELQSFLGKINFLRRFISNSAGKIQPFSSMLRLKQEQTFKWEEQHQQAFQEIKNYLSNPPVLSPPKRGRPLKLYVSASETLYAASHYLHHRQDRLNQIHADKTNAERQNWEMDSGFDRIHPQIRLQEPGVVLEEPLGVRHCYSFQLDFQCTNNRAEYEALIIGLEMLVELGVQSVEILGDSMLVLKQIAGEYKCLNPSLGCISSSS